MAAAAARSLPVFLSQAAAPSLRPAPWRCKRPSEPISGCLQKLIGSSILGTCHIKSQRRKCMIFLGSTGLFDKSELETLLKLEEQPTWSMKTSLMPKTLVITCRDSTCATDTLLFCTIMQTGHSKRWTQRRKRNSLSFSRKNTELIQTHQNKLIFLENCSQALPSRSTVFKFCR